MSFHTMSNAFINSSFRVVSSVSFRLLTRTSLFFGNYFVRSKANMMFVFLAAIVVMQVQCNYSARTNDDQIDKYMVQFEPENSSKQTNIVANYSIYIFVAQFRPYTFYFQVNLAIISDQIT